MYTHTWTELRAPSAPELALLALCAICGDTALAEICSAHICTIILRVSCSVIVLYSADSWMSSPSKKKSARQSTV